MVLFFKHVNLYSEDKNPAVTKWIATELFQKSTDYINYNVYVYIR
jgi:hypothetical protein